MSAQTVQQIFTRLCEEFGEKIILGMFDPQTQPEIPAPPAAVPGEPPKSIPKKIAGDPYLSLAADSVTRVCSFLRDDPDCLFDSLMCLSGVHEQGDQPAFRVVYHLHSFKFRHHVTLHVRLPSENPTVKSVQGIWSAANWFERETFDLFGINFENHPDLRRLLLPPDWVGYPLRKDYEFPKEYNGISCIRPKLK